MLATPFVSPLRGLDSPKRFVKHVNMATVALTRVLTSYLYTDWVESAGTGPVEALSRRVFRVLSL